MTTVLVLIKNCGANVDAAKQNSVKADDVLCLHAEVASSWVATSHAAAASSCFITVAAETSRTMTEVLLEHGGLDLLLGKDSTFAWTPLHYALLRGQ